MSMCVYKITLDTGQVVSLIASVEENIYSISEWLAETFLEEISQPCAFIGKRPAPLVTGYNIAAIEISENGPDANAFFCDDRKFSFTVR